MREFPGLIWFALPWVGAVLAAGAWYAFALRRASTPHPRRKVLCFYAGLTLVLVTTVSPLEHYGNQALWIAFAGFLVLTMVAAPLLVLGSPLTLAFRASGKSRRRTFRNIYRGSVMSLLGFPLFSWLAFAITTYMWQFSRFTESAARQAPVRELQLASLLAVSVVFWMPALCADPMRWRMAHPLRVLYVLVEMVHKALFGGMFLSMTAPFHKNFPSADAWWAPEALLDQRFSILILWIGGNMIFLVALAGLAVHWMRYETRQTRRTDLVLARKREAERRRNAALEQVFNRGH